MKRLLFAKVIRDKQHDFFACYISKSFPQVSDFYPIFRTLRKLNEALAGNVHLEAMIHSDQGFQYSHPEYQSRIKEIGLTQSMPGRGTYLDYAPIESFFGHFKDGVAYK